MYPMHLGYGWDGTTYDADKDLVSITTLYCKSETCKDGTSWVGKLGDAVCWACGSTEVTRKQPRHWWI